MSAAATAMRDEWWFERARGGGFSHESEHDLALMVSDFLENGGSGPGGSSGADSWCSSDSDSGLPDFPFLADKISRLKRSSSLYENDIRVAVLSAMISIEESHLYTPKAGQCIGSCLRFGIVKALKQSGYNASVCASHWQGCGKVPGGDHEYMEVVDERSERTIIEIDFRSHFEIARAVVGYQRILKAVPVVFVGSMSRLQEYLEAMAQGAKSSLRENSMPIPPWRSLEYLQAKWNSPFKKLHPPDEHNLNHSADHHFCFSLLKRLLFSLHSEREEHRYDKRTSKPKHPLFLP